MWADNVKEHLLRSRERRREELCSLRNFARPLVRRINERGRKRSGLSVEYNATRNAVRNNVSRFCLQVGTRDLKPR